MELWLERKYRKAGYTVGRLYAKMGDQWMFLCNTLEDADRGLEHNTPLKEIKAMKKQYPQQTAIPRGRYEISTRYARGFATTHPWYKEQPLGAHIPCLVDVPGYSGILFHCGSGAEHSAGCILVGWNTIQGRLTDSKKAYRKLAGLIDERRKLDKQERNFITISVKSPLDC